MLTTLKDLCSTFPKVAIQQSPLDNVASQMFDPHNRQLFIQSVSAPTERYGIGVDQDMLRHHNDVVPDFDKYGPNEQYLINKILYSPSYLLYIIGGIGVGKTRFAHFIMSEILPQIISKNEKAQKFGPCTIYYNFLDEGNALPQHEDSDAIRTSFIDSFCDRVEAELYSHEFFDLDFEVGTIWDELFEEYKDQYNKYLSLSFIISQLRLNEAEHKHLVSDYAGTIQKRKVVRQKIRGDQARRLSYLALLLQYARKHYFDSDPAGLLLIVDNVDREPSLVQQVVKLVVKPFARISGGRTIINARQSTYYQQLLDDGASDPIDVVPYCGPTPIEIIKTRIDDFIRYHDEYASFYNPKHLPQLVEGIKYIKDNHINNETFQNLFSSLCGRSIRRGLLLAQSIIHNSVYDPITIINPKTGILDSLSVRVGDVLRAVLVGTDDIFRTNPSNMIDNIFEVASYPGEGYLLKLRILQLIRCADSHGITITRLIDTISAFGYTISMICDAINELKSENKRLVWSDALRLNFRDEVDLVSHGPTRLYISTTGQGYVDNLASNIAYIQEVMLDTKVEADIFGSGWKYDVLEDRFELILKFLTSLSKIDQDEVLYFVSTTGNEEYSSSFCSTELITKKMFISVKERVERILSSVVEGQHRGERKERFRDFKAKHLGIYEDRVITLQNFEYEILK
jgi:hypothetical protein